MIAERIAAPRSIDEAAEIFRESSARDERIGICGGGSEMSVGYAPGPVDLLVRTTLLDRVVDYAPADLVVQVEAGATLAALQAHLAPHGQRLAIDPPEPERATIGGLLATNSFGPRRARFGSLRDLIVGLSLVRADGERVRGGGKVVKNVAGFDLPKIVVGSLGSLGLIATATFRLHPIPEHVRAMCARGLDARDVRELHRAIVAAQIEPAALVARYDAGAYAFYAAFEGFAAGASEQLDRTLAVARALGTPGDEVEAALPFAIDREARTFGDVRIRAAVPPASFETLHREVVRRFARVVDRAEIVAYPSLGIAFASGFARDADAFLEGALAMRRGCEAIGGNLVTLAASESIAERFDPYGTLPPAFPLMRRLKDRFDPTHRINSGRFVGKI